MIAKTSRGFLCGLFALAVLAWVGSTAAVAADGQATFTAQKCNMCHSVPSVELTATMKSEKMKGPDLPDDPRDSEWLTSFLKREVKLDGKDHKKEFKGSEEDLDAIVAWLVELQGSE
jgi:mono/diheme cytochrome c family protein